MQLKTIPDKLDGTKYKIVIPQLLYWNSKTRFNVLPAGRRSGKTDIALTKVRDYALNHFDKLRGRYLLAAPTREQAKFIFWDALLAKIPKDLIIGGSPRIAELYVPLKNATIYIRGMDKPERVEGSYWHGVILDEYGNMKEEVWTSNIRPALAQVNGWCDMIGVPEGRNHYYDLAKKACSNDYPDWGFHTWWSEEVINPNEVKQAEREMHEDIFKQEFRAEFISRSGLVYHAFSSENITDITYDSSVQLYLGFDFNISPQVVIITQVGVDDKNRTILKCLDEVVIPVDSNTAKITHDLAIKIRSYPSFNSKVTCCGDATGFAGKTSQTYGNDWEIVEDVLTRLLPMKPKLQVPKANPPEKNRVNYVNSLLKSYSGERRLLIDRKCKTLINDFNLVTWDNNDSINKKSNKDITHMSDALGYVIFALKESLFSLTSGKFIKTKGVV